MIKGLLQKRLELFEQVQELLNIRSVETGKILRKARYDKTMEDREARTPGLIAMNLEIAQKLETVYAEILRLDDQLIQELLEQDGHE